MSEAENIQAVAPDEVEQSLYAKRQKIYPREVHGIFAALRTSGVLALLGIYYILPWLHWEGHQAVLFDLPARKFYILGLVFWPQDFFYLTLLLIVAAVSLFFFTALAGRLWCGYACPQTVWTEAFLWMERRIEGDRPKQIKLDKAPLSFRKFRIKATKHMIWIGFSVYTGLTFVGYFSPMRELAVDFLRWDLGPWETFWIFFYGFATYGNAGWLREQVCIYMCPYARFQSAMFDKDTLIISYDEKRGEPRGGRKRSADPKDVGLGDCVDCTECVQVCPTGIDIREGPQIGCITCGLCIDACDRVMAQIDRPRGLIDYATLEDCDREAAGGEAKPAWKALLRPRTLVYLGVWSAVGLALLFALGTRSHLDLTIAQDRNPPFMLMSDGSVRNSYTLRLRNMSSTPREMSVSLEELDGGEFWTDGIRRDSAARSQTFTVPADQTRSVRAYVVAPRGTAQQEFAFVLSTEDERPETDRGTIRFSAPEENR